MNKSVTNEKPQAPAGTEAQGDKAKQTSEFPKRDDTWEEKICPMPLTPCNCPVAGELSLSGYSKDNDGVPYYLGFHFNDYNELGLRLNPCMECRISININWLENASNRILAALCFFRWNGTEYEQVSLYEDHKDLQYIALGHVVEFEAHTPLSLEQFLIKEIYACKSELRGSKGEITEDRQADLKIRIAELVKEYKEAEKNERLRDLVEE